jgi:hypothetical protein
VSRGFCPTCVRNKGGPGHSLARVKYVGQCEPNALSRAMSAKSRKERGVLPPLSKFYGSRRGEVTARDENQRVERPTRSISICYEGRRRVIIARRAARRRVGSIAVAAAAAATAAAATAATLAARSRNAERP